MSTARRGRNRLGVFVRVALFGAAIVVSVGCGGERSNDSSSEASRGDDRDRAPVPAEMTADDIAVSFTPAGGWTVMPPPVLERCTEPLVDAAVDMRGTWSVVGVEVAGADTPDHEAIGQEQRIEQCGDRVVITAGGIVHDMRADGTEEGGVHDVAASDKTTPIVAVATFEEGVHVLRPVGTPIEVTRRVDGDQLVWEYVGFTARLERVGA